MSPHYPDKGHKSLGSLCNVWLLVVPDQGTDRQGHLLSCFRQLKNHYGDISGPASVKIIVPDLTSFPLVMLRPWYSVLMLPGHMSQMLRVCFLSFSNSSWLLTYFCPSWPTIYTTKFKRTLWTQAANCLKWTDIYIFVRQFAKSQSIILY